MSPFLRRARGRLFWLVRRRPLAIAVGAALAVPSAWLQFRGSLPAAWAEGLALVTLATGVALLWTGLTGARPDWIDSEGQQPPRD
jgi:hypothetical protein